MARTGWTWLLPAALLVARDVPACGAEEGGFNDRMPEHSAEYVATAKEAQSKAEFALIDTDFDGRISLQEMADAMLIHYEAPQFDYHWLHLRWLQLDTDHDGTLTLEEHRTALDTFWRSEYTMRHRSEYDERPPPSDMPTGPTQKVGGPNCG